MIPSGYSRNVISGTLPNGEIFQTGFWCDEAPDGQSATQSQADAIANDINLALTDTGNPNTYLGAGSSLQRVTTYSYLTSSGTASFVAESNLAPTSGSGEPTLPNQCAVVLSLQTGNAGRRNRGRMYIPINKIALSGGELASTDVDNIAGWWSALLTAVNGDLGDQHVVVLSQVGGTAHPVIAIRVDSKVDIQRRRADREAAAYAKTDAVTHP